MSSSGAPKEDHPSLPDFPDVEAKLHKVHKQSAFEKQKADAEAKRKREEAETAAVYESFVKSFDRDGSDSEDEISAIARGSGAGFRGGFAGRGGPPPAFGGLGGGAGRRHFGAREGNDGSQLGVGTGLKKSGPGSLGPMPSSYGPRRGFGDRERDFGRRDEPTRAGQFGFRDDEREREVEAKGLSKAFDTSDDEADRVKTDRAEEKAVAKPTLRLANLPPGTSPAVIKALIPSNLTVENVKILPPAAPGSSERKSMTAIVILSQETPASDIDAAVSLLQNRYLGYGFYLSLHRHLSSAVATATTTSSLTSTTVSHPFGAKAVVQNNDHNPHLQSQFHRGFAPPSSYGPAGAPFQRNNILHVPVQAPRDIKQLQLIHKVVEAVLEHGPEFEALLMSRPNVQREEKWAWLWDARSEGGVWYRWRLWEVITGTQFKGRFVPLFEGSDAWKTPDKPLAYEYTTDIDEFVSDEDYNSSDDDEFEEEGNKQNEGGPAGDTENTYLNPLDKAKLVHLLSRLPTTLSRIRKGDIARVTTFAITHASRGADEIVDMIVTNILKPFALTSANPDHKRDGKGEVEDTAARAESNTSTPHPEDASNKPSSNEPVDTSASSLVGLYIVSDILSSSATSGVRHSWRYRQLFESALRERKVFEHLGLTAERMGWGRLRADKWKRSVGLILGLWEGWCVFPAESQELFVKTFENPPSAAKKEADEEAEGSAGEGEKKAGRWKPVETGATGGFKPVSAAGEKGYDFESNTMDIDDVDGEAMDEDTQELMDQDIDGVPMDDDVDGDPMDEDRPVEQSTLQSLAHEAREEQDQSKASAVTAPASGENAPPRRQRMRAVDMFADSDEEAADAK